MDVPGWKDSTGTRCSWYKQPVRMDDYYTDGKIHVYMIQYLCFRIFGSNFRIAYKYGKMILDVKNMGMALKMINIQLIRHAVSVEVNEIFSMIPLVVGIF